MKTAEEQRTTITETHLEAAELINMSLRLSALIEMYPNRALIAAMEYLQPHAHAALYSDCDDKKETRNALFAGIVNHIQAQLDDDF